MPGRGAIELSRSARKALVALDRSGQRPLLRRIHRGLRLLADEPFAARPGADIEPLEGRRGHFRLRVSDHRVKYVVLEKERRVLVYDISPRESAYR
jgi:mRNA-degrading endonuclease RelE of RelBE toxin-antitoxin system